MTETIIPVVLAGGAGTRLWPLSRAEFPKQFLPLYDHNTMLQNTLRRARGISGEYPILVTHQDHRFIAAEQTAAAHLGPIQLVLEPIGKNTAIAVAAAAHLVMQRRPNALMLVMAADHVIENPDAFKVAVAAATQPAARGQLMTFGITPRFAATGYGYIAKGDAMREGGAFAIERFVEKPDAPTAQQYLADGTWLWNSGMFLMRADCYLHELRQYDPTIADAAAAAVADADKSDQAIALASHAYENAPARSIDHAVMEHTRHAGVVPCDIGWSDVGSWSSLWDIGDKDKNNNVILGEAVTHNTEKCYIRTDGPMVATHGIQDTVIIATRDVVMVSSRQNPQDIQQVISQLRDQQRHELTTPRCMHRPWGSHEVIAEADNFKVKRIIVKPGARLSLQRHQHRSEHWVVVRGIATVEIRESQSELRKTLHPNTSAYIPRGAIHRLSNPGTEELEVIEVQCGDYLAEDDIERFSDDYGRGAA